MKRFMFYFCISLAIMISMVAFPAVVSAQDGPRDPDVVGEGEFEVGGEGEGELVVPEGYDFVIAPDEAAEGGEMGEAEGGEAGEAEGGEAGEAEGGEAGEAEGGEAGEAEGGEAAEVGSGAAASEAPTTLPVTGGTTQATTYMVVLAVLGLLLAGSFVTRAFQRAA